MKNILIPKAIIRGGLLKNREYGVRGIGFQLKGHFRVELISRAGIIKQSLEFDNLITDAGLDGIGTNNIIGNLITYAAMGTGSTAPANSDTDLDAEVSPSSTNRTSDNGSISPVNTYEAGPPDYVQLVRTYVFDFDQANGNLTEIGLFSDNTTGIMWTRQLLKDGTGTPTTVTKTSSDQLRITYTVRAYPPQEDITDTVTISGTDYDWTSRAAKVPDNWTSNIFNTASSNLTGDNTEAFDGSIGARTDSPSGTGTFPSSHAQASYVSGNFYLEQTVTWDAATGNANWGALAFFCASGIFMQMGFDPVIPKNNTNQLQLVYRITWGRYTP